MCIYSVVVVVVVVVAAAAVRHGTPATRGVLHTAVHTANKIQGRCSWCFVVSEARLGFR